MAKRLVVVVPGMLGREVSWRPLLDRLRAEPELIGSEWLFWPKRPVKPWSFGSAAQMSRNLQALIDQRWAHAGGYDEVILVGHSIGGILVRQTYLLAAGACPSALADPSPWADKVRRIVLFASINRGADPKRVWYLRPAMILTSVLGVRRRLLGNDALLGSRFITDLRIRWMRHFGRADVQLPEVVQVLGTGDGLVIREDSLDLEQFPNGHAISVPDATHDNLYRLQGIADPEGRYQLLRAAFIDPGSRREEPIRGATGGTVVFVLHGIRATNDDWVQHTRECLHRRAPEVIVVTSDYRWLSALGFALPWHRRRYLAWLRDQYTLQLSHHPAARFQFIGHSAGTYILGRTFLEVASMQFDRVALVGSVLPRDYPWQKRIEQRQVTRIRNDRSHLDMPVGWLCSGLHGLFMRDVGTGGWAGFEDTPAVEEVFYHRGNHEGGLRPENLERLADYACGDDVLPPADELRSRPPRWFGIVSRLAPVLMAAVIGGLILLDVKLGHWLTTARHLPPWQAAFWCAAAAALGLLVLDVL